MAATSDVFVAALLDEADRLRGLLADGADPNQVDAQGFTPLHLACLEWSVGAVRLLLEAGAEVDAATEPGGFTPLMLAVLTARGRSEIPELLFSAGADPDRTDRHGESALDLARKRCDTGLEWLLCERAHN